MKKRYIVELIIVIIALALPIINGEKKVTIKQLQEVTVENIDSTIVQQQDSKKIRKLYKISEQEYEAYFSYGAISYMDVDEVTIFQQQDKQKREALITKIQTYLDTKVQMFKGYGEQQTKMLEKALVIQTNNYVICIVSDNKIKDKIVKCF